MFGIGKPLAAMLPPALAITSTPGAPRRQTLDSPSEIQVYLCAAGCFGSIPADNCARALRIAACSSE